MTSDNFKHPYMAVACPSCGAKAGGWCKRPSGHSGPFVAFHAARRKAAEEAATQAEGQGESVALVTQTVPGTLSWAVETHIRVKAEQREALCFVRLGDFYETFNDDAILTAAALDVVLTSRPLGQGQRMPMTGFPAHAGENYFARLLAAGHKLAVIEPDGAARTLTAAVATVSETVEAEPLVLFLSVPKEAIAGRGVPVQLALF
jgi:hypothetical protein